MQPPDENGNEWVDDPVPGALEIATVMIERIQAVGWKKAWGSCDGMDICRRYTDKGTPGNFYQAPGTYCFLAGYQDLDYEQAYLLTVMTQTDDETWVDYLAILQHHAGTSKLDVEWRNDRHRFFDNGDHRTRALHWWIDVINAMGESYNEALKKDRQRRRALGLW